MCFVQPPSECQKETEIPRQIQTFLGLFYFSLFACDLNSFSVILFITDSCMNVFIKQIISLPLWSNLSRYGTGQRPLLPYEPHLTVDISSGDSSSGFTSQESTMERCKTGTPPSSNSTEIIKIFFTNNESQYLCLNSDNPTVLSPDSTAPLIFKVSLIHLLSKKNLKNLVYTEDG